MWEGILIAAIRAVTVLIQTVIKALLSKRDANQPFERGVAVFLLVVLTLSLGWLVLWALFFKSPTNEVATDGKCKSVLAKIERVCPGCLPMTVATSDSGATVALSSLVPAQAVRAAGGDKTFEASLDGHSGPYREGDGFRALLSSFADGGADGSPDQCGFPSEPSLPATCVPWAAAHAYADYLSALTRLTIKLPSWAERTNLFENLPGADMDEWLSDCKGQVDGKSCWARAIKRAGGSDLAHVNSYAASPQRGFRVLVACP